MTSEAYSPFSVLKPCPFCETGTRTVWKGDSAEYYVFCLTCAARGPTASTPIEAERRWGIESSGNQEKEQALEKRIALLEARMNLKDKFIEKVMEAIK